MSAPRSRRSQERLALLTYVKLMRAANSARNFAARTLAETGLTLTQFAVLEALYHLGPMSLSEVAQKVLTTGGNLTMVAGNLEKQGLARRQPSPEDKRLQIMALTPKGKSLIRQAFPQHAAAIVEFLSTLSSEEQANLGDLCRRLGRQETEHGKARSGS
jgi:MarR family transcriptional regulator, 2-MHQ and catechol-resistance regulon repressor